MIRFLSIALLALAVLIAVFNPAIQKLWERYQAEKAMGESFRQIRSAMDYCLGDGAFGHNHAENMRPIVEACFQNPDPFSVTAEFSFLHNHVALTQLENAGIFLKNPDALKACLQEAARAQTVARASLPPTGACGRFSTEIATFQVTRPHAGAPLQTVMNIALAESEPHFLATDAAPLRDTHALPACEKPLENTPLQNSFLFSLDVETEGGNTKPESLSRCATKDASPEVQRYSRCICDTYFRNVVYAAPHSSPEAATLLVTTATGKEVKIGQSAPDRNISNYWFARQEKQGKIRYYAIDTLVENTN